MASGDAAGGFAFDAVWEARADGAGGDVEEAFAGGANAAAGEGDVCDALTLEVPCIAPTGCGGGAPPGVGAAPDGDGCRGA